MCLCAFGTAHSFHSEFARGSARTWRQWILHVRLSFRFPYSLSCATALGWAGRAVSVCMRCLRSGWVDFHGWPSRPVRLLRAAVKRRSLGARRQHRHAGRLRFRRNRAGNDAGPLGNARARWKCRRSGRPHTAATSGRGCRSNCPAPPATTPHRAAALRGILHRAGAAYLWCEPLCWTRKCVRSD